MLALLLTVLLSPTGEHQNLKAHNYEVREQATRQLKSSGVVCLPFLYLSGTSSDKEQERRTKDIIHNNSYVMKKSMYVFVSLWLIYGPDELPRHIRLPEGISRRYLYRNRRVAYRLPYECLETFNQVVDYLKLNKLKYATEPYSYLGYYALDADGNKEEIISYIENARFKAYDQP